MLCVACMQSHYQNSDSEITYPLRKLEDLVFENVGFVFQLKVTSSGYYHLQGQSFFPIFDCVTACFDRQGFNAIFAAVGR